MNSLKEKKQFKLILVDLQKALVDEWKKNFGEFKNVEIIHGKFEDVKEYDCIVSAANSFGLMDGGVDAAISNKFGKQLAENVRDYILENFDGEQPVGTSFIIETESKEHPFLAHTPTMRVPYSIQGTDYVYLAMKAMLTAVYNHNKNQPSTKEIKSVLCVGLGTFYGKMNVSEAARQMFLAFRCFLNPPSYIDWDFASRRQEIVKYGGYQGFETFSKEKKDKDFEKKSEISRLEISNQIRQTEEFQYGDDDY